MDLWLMAHGCFRQIYSIWIRLEIFFFFFFLSFLFFCSSNILFLFFFVLQISQFTLGIDKIHLTYNLLNINLSWYFFLCFQYLFVATSRIRQSLSRVIILCFVRLTIYLILCVGCVCVCGGVGVWVGVWGCACGVWGCVCVGGCGGVCGCVCVCVCVLIYIPSSGLVKQRNLFIYCFCKMPFSFVSIKIGNIWGWPISFTLARR